MMALAYEYIMKSPENVRTQVFSVFNKTAIEVCEGQQYDMNFETAGNVVIPEYLEMIRLKTAVLLAGSLKIGAIIGGASEAVSDELYRFGENIGIAFQLMDDLLDVFSDAGKFGKATGGDIVSNKKTFLYLKAIELADGKTLAALRRWFSETAVSPDLKVDAVKKIYQDLHIRSHTEKKIDRYYREAMQSLNNLPVDKNKKTELKRFADQLNKRDF
jgi:geranylgeranyl diphosphate synthase type II